jgi:hypothetical protein
MTIERPHRWLPLIALLLISPVTFVSAFSQDSAATPQRIEVQAGGPARLLKGEIKNRKEVAYVFKAKAGQKFSGRITRQTGDASFAITDPNGEALPEEEYDVNTNLKGSLTKNGDYKITVNTINTPNSRYSLSIKVY